MIVTRKDSVWKCLVLPYELDFNVRNTVMSNRNKKLMLQYGKVQFKKKVDTVVLKRESIYGDSYGC